MIISIEQRHGQLLISYVNKEGHVSYKKINIPPKQQYNYVYTNQTNKAAPGKKSWDNKLVRKVPANFLSKNRIQELFVDLGDKISDLFQQNMPLLSSADIEVHVDETGFPDPNDAKNPINTIAWSRYPEVVVFGNKQLSSEEISSIENRINDHIKSTGKKYDFTYKYHENEADLIYDFLYNYARHDTLLTGWNFWGYDWKYIVNRCKNINLDISWMSPTRQWYRHKIMNRGHKEFIMLPQHKLIVDYMTIYKKWDRTIDIKENDSLDYVAEKATGIKKVKYKGSFQQLYDNDYDLYVFYNAIDTILVEEIHRNLKTMNTFLLLGNITGVEAMSAFSPISMLESTLTRYAYKRNVVFPKSEKNKASGKYEGAFVFEPKPGLYTWVASFDFASLYPTIIRQFNISIENFIRKDKNSTPEEHEVKCSSGAIFDTSNDPLLPSILTDYYNDRKKNKSIAQKAEAEAEHLKQILNKRKNKVKSTLE